MAQMTFLDFFSGIGGFRKGFELCGMRCVGHCEIDKYADRSYRAIHDVKEDEWYAADITKIKPAEIPRADLWAGGFPCQDISVAGRQRGLDGARSGLFFTFAELVKGQSPENRPTWIVLENVKNLLSIHGGWDFAIILDTLASLGYHIEYGLLNTKDFGPPQNRERVYLVAYRHFGAGSRSKIFPIPAGRGKTLIQLIGGMQGQRVYDPSGISVTMASQSGGWGGKTGLYFIDLCNGKPRLTPYARCVKAKYNSGITNRRGDNSGVFYGGTDPLEASCSDGKPLVGHGLIRRLTPRECWRLQGFTDEMFDRARAVNSDNQLYRQAGNTVTIQVVYAIGQQIVAVQEAFEQGD